MAEAIDYCSIMRATPDLYLIISPALLILDASNAYLEATMVKREDILGCYLFDVFPDNPNDPNATGANNLNRSIQAVLKTKAPHAMPVQKYDIRRPEDQGGGFEERYWSPLNTPVLDKNNEVSFIIHRVEDVTEINRIRQSGIETTRRLQLLVESIKDYAIIMLDKKGRISTWNAGAELIFGYAADEVTGKPISILFPQASYGHGDEELKNAKENGRYEEQGWRLRKNGSKFWSSVTVSPVYVKSHFDHKNHLIGYAKVLRDLTYQKDVEMLKQELISVVNHELRTPLTCIFGAMRLLSNWKEQSSQKNNYLLNIANSNCDRLLVLINDMLDVEKLAGGKSLHFQIVELTSLVSQAISLHKNLSEVHGGKINLYSLDKEIYVDVDPNRLIQVLTNLLSNAIKFSDNNHPVSVRLSQIGKSVRIAVINHGKGISSAFQEKLFEKFSQEDVSTTRTGTGAGLGLAISKEIVDCLGSTIKCSSVPNGETSFYFDLEVIGN